MFYVTVVDQCDLTLLLSGSHDPLELTVKHLTVTTTKVSSGFLTFRNWEKCITISTACSQSQLQRIFFRTTINTQCVHIATTYDRFWENLLC